MRIETEIELDYSDVLIKPRRSTIASRKDADITREYKFRWSGRTVKGTGIMQANMGTIGNFEVSRKMLNSGLFACLHKHHNVEDLVEFETVRRRGNVQGGDSGKLCGRSFHVEA